MRRQIVSRENKIEVDEQDQRKHGADGVKNVANVTLTMLTRPRSPGDDPPGDGDGRRPDGGAGKRPGGGPGDEEPDERAADPHDRIGEQKNGHGREPMLALENPVTETRERDTSKRQRDEDAWRRRVEVQEPHQQGRRRKHNGRDDRTGGQPQRDKLPHTVTTSHPQGGDCLHAHGRHSADDQNREQGPQFPEGGGHQQASGEHVEQIGGELVAGNPRGHEERGRPSGRNPGSHARTVTEATGADTRLWPPAPRFPVRRTLIC